jgi:acetolactate synthase-1/2/3 large subunit
LTELLNQLALLQEKDADSLDLEALARWWAQIDEWRANHGLLTGQRYRDSDFIQPQQVIDSLYRITRGDAFVTSDVGQHQMFAAQYYPFDKPRRWINSGGLGTMGFGLPAAIGVKLAFPDQDVACVTGEGSIQMNIQEPYEDSLPDFVKLMEAYGHVGFQVDKLSELDDKMAEAFALKDKLVFLDIIVDPMEHVYPMHVAPNGSMQDMWLSKNERT